MTLVEGLLRAKEEFRLSTDSRGGCKILSLGDACNCFLCRIDNLLAQMRSQTMRKDLEVAHPTSCWNKATDSELVFVLLGRDKAAPAAIEAWCQERIRIGKNVEGDPQIVDARRCAAEMVHRQLHSTEK